MEISTEIDINASAQTVWRILTDFAEYPHWNPFIRQLAGSAQAGATLQAGIQPPGGKIMRFSPTLLAADPDRELRWRGHWLLPALFRGEHYFQIRPLAADRVLFVQGENFSGLLLPLFRASLNTGTRAGFQAMNQALKARAEAMEQL